MAGVYARLPQNVSDYEKAQGFGRAVPRPAPPTRSKRALVALGVLLSLSVSVNAIMIYQRYCRPWELAQDLPTKFAHLRRNIPTEIVDGGAHDSLNRTIQDAAWNTRDMEPWNGFLALDEDYVVAQDLPHSQRWPWDLSKGVYIMSSSHFLHCTRALRGFVNENHDRVPEPEQTWEYAHMLHCLDVLRENIICSADDTPLFIGRLHGNIGSDHPRAGIGSMKMCRNWTALQEWGRARSACYRPEVDNEIDRYKYCPDGSRPWEIDEA